MQVPVQVTFRDIPKDEAIDNLVHELTKKLEEVCPHIDSCRVAIEHPHVIRRAGGDFRVRIDLTVPPGHEIVVSRESNEINEREVLEPLVREAFHAARRRVQKLAERQRQYVKAHPEQEVQAVVTQLFEDYGFAQTPEGREIYFHKNSVLAPGFEAMRIGNGLAFTEETGEDGPQASSVRIVDRRGHEEEDEGNGEVEVEEEA